jgi:hypothetical protein
VRIIVLVLAVLALFYFDALEESHGNRNKLSFDGTARHGHNAGGADVHCEIFVRPDRGQVNA